MSSPNRVRLQLPKSWPTYIIKCRWDATALILKIQAKNEDDAIERACAKVGKMEGGMRCQEIKVIGVR